MVLDAACSMFQWWSLIVCCMSSTCPSPAHCDWNKSKDPTVFCLLTLAGQSHLPLPQVLARQHQNNYILRWRYIFSVLVWDASGLSVDTTKVAKCNPYHLGQRFEWLNCNASRSVFTIWHNPPTIQCPEKIGTVWKLMGWLSTDKALRLGIWSVKFGHILYESRQLEHDSSIQWQHNPW